MGRRWVVVGAVVLVAAVAGAIVWASTRGAARSAQAGDAVTVRRGDVAITVGGIGHVTTLTGAARGPITVAAGTGAGAGGAAATTGAGAAGSPGASSSAGSSPGGSAAPPDAVFPSVGGHVVRLLVHTGEQVVAGQPIAQLADDGTLRGNEVQARADLATARLELAQKQVQDPAHGLPPTPQEVQAGRQAIAAAQAKLARLQAPPLAADVAAARSDVVKARSDLRVARADGPSAVAAAQVAVDAARQKLAVLSGAPDPAEVAVARLELAKATVDQETLLHPGGAGPLPSAVAAADAAVALGQAKLAEAQASGTPLDVAAARADLTKAQAERDTLTVPAPGPTPAAAVAAQLAVEAAQRRLDAVLHPPAATVGAARAELARTESDLATARATHGSGGLDALRAARTAARARLARLLAPPLYDAVATARTDVRKARGDLAVLRQRGAPASATDLALARLKVGVGVERLALARELGGRLTVRAPASGTVTSVLTVEGAGVDAVTPVARVQDLQHVVVSLDLSEFDVARTRVGAPAIVTVDALGGRVFGGRVRDVALGGTENGGVVNFPVIIGLRSHGPLRPGMSVSARIVVRRVRNVVRVPVAAVTDGGGGPTVTVRVRSGALERRRVRLGLAGATYVQVRSGVRAGERIVVPAGGGA